MYIVHVGEFITWFKKRIQLYELYGFFLRIQIDPMIRAEMWKEERKKGVPMTQSSALAMELENAELWWHKALSVVR